MKHAAFAAALAILGAVAPAQAGTQVVAGDGLTLTEAARIKFNRDASAGDRQVAVERVAPSGDYTRLAASFGMDADEAAGLTLDQVFVAKINHGASGGDQQLVKRFVGMGTRSQPSALDHAQLAASAGLDPVTAAGMSLKEIAAVKFESSND